MLELLLLVPPAAALVCVAARSRVVDAALLAAYAVLHLAVAVAAAGAPEAPAFTRYFRADALAAVFLLILSAVFAAVVAHGFSGVLRPEGERGRNPWYAPALLVFAGAMSAGVLSTHAALTWVFIEATTLASAPLIMASRTRPSLEAAWKYLFICSIGIALALVGIVLLGMGLGPAGSLFFDDLVGGARNIVPFWLQVSFPFILLGLGTKVGIAPVHSWLPDAHAEAPSAISALLSGALLNVAFLAILRFNRVMREAGLGAYAETLLLGLGLLSVLVGAVYLLQSRNYKRMLAFSSIEHLGIAAVGIGAGGAARYAALLHLVGHSFAKASFFLSAGNVIRRYRTRDASAVRGLLAADPLTGWLWLLAFIAIAGIPPFPTFLSEFSIVRALFSTGSWLPAVLLLFLLTVALAGMGKTVLAMAFGPAPEGVPAARETVPRLLPQALLLVALAWIGLAFPGFLHDLLTRAAALL